MKALVEYFVSRSIFVNLLTVLLILMGGYYALTMNREAFPNIDFDIVTVATVYPGASSEDIEKLVTTPIEESIKEVDGIKKYRSVSVENRSVITITIDPDEKDTRKVVDDIRSAVDRTPDLPDDAEQPIVAEIGTARTPVIEFYLSRVEKNGKLIRTERELRDQVRILEKRLLNVKGVARIIRKGWLETEMQVMANPHLMDRFYINFESIIQALKNQNRNIPGGRIEARGKEIVIRTLGEFNTAEEISKVVIRSNEIGQAIRLKQVAKVREGFKEQVYIERTDGNQAVSLIVLKRRSADAIKVVDATKNVAKELSKELETGFKVGYVNDFSFFIRRRLGVLVSNGIGGLLLVVLSLFLFLGWRTALMASLGIPVALGMTFIAMNQLGVTMNLIAMFGLIMVIGIIVDDAIIVCENIYRYIESGREPYEAVVTGVGEVIAPVMATIATTIAAFGPMLFMTGIMGKFIRFIPLVVILALLASLLESFFVLPSHMYDMNKHVRKKAESNKKEGWFELFCKRYYLPALRWALGHRGTVFSLLFASLVGVGSLQIVFGKFKLFPSAIDIVHIKLSAENGLTKDETVKFVTVLEKYAATLRPDDKKLPLKKRELKHIVSRVGIQRKDANDPFTRRGSNYAQLLLFLTPEQDRKRKTIHIIEQLRAATKWMLNPKALQSLEEKLVAERKAREKRNIGKRFINWAIKIFRKKSPARIPVKKAMAPKGYEHLAGRLIALEFDTVSGGPPVGKPVAIQITGDDFSTMEIIAKKYKKIMAGIKGITDIDDDRQPGKDELRLKINERLAAQTGVSAVQIGIAVNAAFEGAVATSIRRIDQEVDVRVRFADEFRKSTENLDQVYVLNPRGYRIPVSRLARIEKGRGTTAINHLDGQRLLTISANLNEDIIDSRTANSKIAKLGAKIPAKFPGYKIKYGGEYEDTQESMSSLFRAFAVALVIIIMILSSLFRSLSQPLVVVSAIPFALIGVFLAFLVHGHPFSFLGFMGIVGLSGVVVNDSIVLVDFANKIRDENPDMEIDEIIVKAAGLRLRAVILTTITTVLGLLPTAYGFGGYDPFLVPMALSFSWGLLFSTVLTLIIVPALYKTEYNIKHRVRRHGRQIIKNFMRKAT